MGLGNMLGRFGAILTPYVAQVSFLLLYIFLLLHLLCLLRYLFEYAIPPDVANLM